ncbi:hypothetical protein [Streptococcus himalayensis]|uniref:ABC transporter membrane protein n=1 Tax=Streptococcus himalayensis TaxID=1888195 RepID=A0A917EF20_9STRE|nr:hypothetical protein [Streptococcus himalayensis]GGE31435.1 hypothetical protein GCM10011510_10920 [Streptococcus himalayensis]
MRLKAIKTLTRMNILYATSANNLNQYRKKQAKNPTKPINPAKKLIVTYLLVGILYLFIFGMQAAVFPLVKQEGLFTNLLGMFYLYVFSQGFLSFYNVFYESKDLQSYRPYAFSEAEIMAGKGVSVLLPCLIGIFPILAYVIGLQFQVGHPIWLACIIFLLTTILIFSNLTALLLVGVHFVTKTNVFRQHKQILSNLLITLASLIGFGAIIFVNSVGTKVSENGEIWDVSSYFPFMKPFHDFGVDPFAPKSLLGMGAWLAVTAFLGLVIYKKVLPEFYESALQTTTTVNKVKKSKALALNGIKDFPSFVWRYQLNLISDGSVFIQAVLMPSVTPYIFFLPALISGNVLHSQMFTSILSLRYGVTFILLAVFIASMNVGGVNLTAIGLSLERENYEYLKVLPFDMKRYIRLKFWYLTLLQSIIPLILLIVLGFVMRLPFSVLLLMLITWVVTSLGWGAWGYQHDKRHMVTNWSNITELSNRGNSTLKMILGMVGFMIYLVVTIFSAFILYQLPEYVGYVLTGLVFLLVAGLSIWAMCYYLKKLAELEE